MKVFDMPGNNTNLVAEILAGITSFITMSYLLVECPALIVSKEVSQSTVYISFCIASFIGCVIMGLWAKQPFVVGPSIGLTAFFGATFINNSQYKYSTAMLFALFAGVLFFGLVISGVGNSLFYGVSGSMKNGISAGVGLYIALIGLKSAGLLSGESAGSWQIADLFYNKGNCGLVIVLTTGLIVIGLSKKISLPFPPLLGIAASGGAYFVCYRFLHILTPPERPKLNGNGKRFTEWFNECFFTNLRSGIDNVINAAGITTKTVLLLLIALLVWSVFNMTDSVGVTYAIAKNHGKFDDKGNFGGFKNTMLSSAASSLAGSFVGCPMLSVAPESVAGICAQGKSGLTAVTTGVLFLGAAFLAPAIEYIPSVLTACVMVYIGFTMLGAVKEIDCGDIGEGIPALMTIILIPLTSSIVDGIALGIIFHVVLNMLTLNFKAVKFIEIGIAVLFGVNYFYL